MWGTYKPEWIQFRAKLIGAPRKPMARFLIKRLLNMIPLIIGITFLSFLVMSLAPGNFLTSLKLNPAISPQVIRQMEAQFGLDQPLLTRYAKWLWQVLHLDLGMSMSYRVNVSSLIAARAFNTVILALASMIFAWVVAIPIGIVVAVKQNSIWDRVLSFVGVLRHVGAELFSRLSDDVPGAAHRMVPGGRNFFPRL